MALLAWGVNYQTAPLHIREKLAVSKQETYPLLRDIVRDALVSEVVLVSTCNRTELYAVGTNSELILPWMSDYFSLKLMDLKPYLYLYNDEQAVMHLMGVACGLKSMVLGEVEILGQIKQAYHLAREQKTLGKLLNRLFQKSFFVAKTVRSQTEIGMNPVSVASTAVKLAERIFSDLNQATVLLIGAGDLIQLTATHLKQAGVHKLLVANRSTLRGEKLAKMMNATAIGLEDLPHRLHEADIVITGTSSILPLIGKGMVEQALQQRRRRSILMIDLAVPRDIEPQVGSLEDVYLYCIDDLKGMVEENRKIRQDAVQAAEQIIVKESDNFIQWFKAQASLGTLKAFRSKFELIRDELLKEASDQIKSGKAPEEVLKRFTSLLFNRLMHPPTRRLRQAGFQNDESILQFTRELFELNHEIINT